MITATFHEDAFRDKVALIAGGTSGIGAAIGNALSELGASVTVTGTTVAEAQEAQSRPSFWVERAVALDVRDEAAIAACFAGRTRLDILINCAGTIRRDEEHDPLVFADVVDVNLTGTFRMCAAARPLLGKSKGCIVNTASVLSFFGGARAPGYSASKGGVAQLTKSLALAYAAEGIRVNAVAPGWIATPLTQALRDDPARSTAIVARTPLGRWGEPDDVAGAAIFLCSPAAAFVTGAILAVDGGYMAG
ncbi:MAG TPA: SDR family oxidoreductase [Casimicrobiaceae bacterium]|jgi:NAD(P)-dependent dehydrogenase (short-subunit alcohol dehydrogenase family)|nr:SDR family oxidoreductase [Casimicrobiaceae bacterium]